MGRGQKPEVTYSYGEYQEEPFVSFSPPGPTPTKRYIAILRPSIPEGTRLIRSKSSKSGLSLWLMAGTSGLKTLQLVDELRAIAQRHKWVLRHIP